MKLWTSHHADCLNWIATQPDESFHAVCTDPPYGLVEFSSREVEKLRQGRGGVWRLPPKFDGKERNPLPRFTVLSENERAAIGDYFAEWGRILMPKLVPGAHLLIAGNPSLQSYVQQGMTLSGYEVRGAILRVYHGFRGGDRPKNAEQEFPDICVTPRGNYEPWMLFRKPISEKTVAENLRKWKTGGLRMIEGSRPLPDVIQSGKTPRIEKQIADHPSLKPQHFLRILVRTLLPLGEGRLLEPFMGSGSTLAACQAVGIESVGVEIDERYFMLAQKAIPQLASLHPGFTGATLSLSPESLETPLVQTTLF
jgi:DNA modification methylase